MAAEARKSAKIKFTKREVTGKGTCRKLRVKGVVPAVFYGPEYKESLVGSVNAKELGHVANSVNWETNMIDLELPDGTVEMALLRNVQRHAITQNILHVDLYQLVKGHKVKVTVPIRVINREISAGVKMGGVFEQYLRDVEMSVLPREIPSDIEIDVAKLAIGNTVTLNDLNLPESAELSLQGDTIVVTVAKPRSMADLPEAEEAEEVTEVEVVGKGKKKDDEE